MLHESISISETDGVIQNDLTVTKEHYENTTRIIPMTCHLLKISLPYPNITFGPVFGGQVRLPTDVVVMRAP